MSRTVRTRTAPHNGVVPARTGELPGSRHTVLPPRTLAHRAPPP